MWFSLDIVVSLWFSCNRTSYFLDILDSFDEYDVDHNNSLSLEEFRQIYDNPKIFHILDKNDDGGITKTELRKLLKNIQDEENEPTISHPPNPQDYNYQDDTDNNNSEDTGLTPDDDAP